MAALSTTDRQRISRGLQRYWSRLFEEVDILDADVLAAVDATDDYIDSIQANYNNSLPTAAKNNLTTAQKTLLFCAVALARVSIPFLRSVFGEVD